MAKNNKEKEFGKGIEQLRIEKRFKEKEKKIGEYQGAVVREFVGYDGGYKIGYGEGYKKGLRGGREGVIKELDGLFVKRIYAGVKCVMLELKKWECFKHGKE